MREDNSQRGRPTRLAVDLTRAPSDVDRIVLCVTIEEADLSMAAFSRSGHYDDRRR
jgi:stress response protein SCP2